MNKKIITLALALTIPLTVAAFPGDMGDFKGHHAHRIEKMTKNLDLTVDQKTKVEALFNKQEEKFKAIHEETQAGLQKILTKEQMTKMEELKKQRHEKWQKRHEGLKDQKVPETAK
jgi:periplasmic protein CpxP/Spy